jgi:hypothetical protein
MPPNQAIEIWEAFKSLGESTPGELVEATGWNRHVVELVMDRLVYQGMARIINADTVEPRYEAIYGCSGEVGPTSS